jgi:hypothetical protein
MGKPILCVDFDGVIHSYTSGWKGADVVSDPPVPGALEFLRQATKSFDVCIYSSRSAQRGGIQAMAEALHRWDIGLEGLRVPSMQGLIEDNLIRFPAEKPAAFLTIDDRAICFTGTWPSMAEMLAFKPWNKR